MKIDETVKFILQNEDSLNPAVLKTVLSSIESDKEEGGGGSSDFSFAQVTVEGDDEILAPLIMFEDTPPYICATNASGQFTVPLYKGRAMCSYYGDKTVTVSGNAEVQGSNVIINGDCTITITE